MPREVLIPSVVGLKDTGFVYLGVIREFRGRNDYEGN
jgi:hypothetical protein